MENVYRQFFIMKQFGNWSFFEAYSLPIQLRNWFYNELIKFKEEERKAYSQ